MAYINTATFISFYAYDATTMLPVDGDAANMSVGLLGDATAIGASGTVVGLGGSTGLYYIDISIAENAFQEMTLYAVSLTPNVVVEPVRWSNDLSGDAYLAYSAANAILGNTVMTTGTATAGGASTITLQSALGANSRAVGCTIWIRGGTGANQVRNITAYVNGTLVATVDRAWETNPDATSVYAILPISQAALSGALKVAGVVLTDTLTTYTGNTVQTGDGYAALTAAHAELGAVPAANASVVNKIEAVFMKVINKETQDATTATIANAAGTTIGSSATSDAAGTFTKGKFA